MREIFAEFRSERGVVVFLGVIFLATVIGPFGTYEALPLVQRFVFWTAAVTSVAVPMHIAMYVCLSSPHLDFLPRIARIALGSAVAAVPGTGLILFVCAVLWPEAYALARLPNIWFQIAAVGFVVGCIHYVRDPAVPPPPAPATPQRGRPRFLGRLDPALGSDIISLTMQDHYVEVTTTEGTQLLLIRFSDALDELDGLDGLRIHRSHWAATAHVECLGRDENKLRVRLSDGRHLPVSQTYAKALRTRLAARDASA